MESILYKYLGAKRSSEYLDNGLLRFSQPGALNDPFEAMPEISSKKARQVRDEYISSKTASTSSNARYDMLSRVPIEYLLDNYLGGWQALFDDKIGIFSCSRRWDSILMWAHYADSHQGFCLGLKKDNLGSLYKCWPPDNSSENDTGPPFSVIYSDTKIQPPLRPEDTFDPKIFYTKSTDWSYEQEERLVVQLALHTECEMKDPYPIYKFKIPYDCISDITLGLRASSELEDKAASRGVV